MSMVLPSTVEEINYMQSSFFSPPPVYVKDTGEDFPNIATGRYVREVSLPNGVQWNVSDFDAYLNFEDPNLVKVEVAQSHEDRLVPGDDQRPRSESISSVTSNMDDRNFVYNNMAVKSFSTVCMDSGSTCVSTDHAYVNLAPSVFKDLDTEETFQNLNPFLSQGPEIHNTDSTASSSFSSSPPLSNSPLNDSHLDYSILSNLSAISTNSQDSFSEKSVTFKRPASTIDEDIFFMTTSKRSCESPDGSRYLEIRKKNNVASKNCRKTRKEKQKEMESRVADLEREREDLMKQIRYLEVMTNEFRKHIKSIMKPLHAV